MHDFACALAHVSRAISVRLRTRRAWIQSGPPRTHMDSRGGSDRFVCASEQTFIGKDVTIHARQGHVFYCVVTTF